MPVLTPIDLQALAVERYGPSARVDKLAGDASNRAYYRVNTGAGSVIFMVHEEAFLEHELPFLNLAAFLGELGVPIPEVLAGYPERGVLILQDLGDMLLQAYLVGRHPPEVEKIYREAIDLLVLLQGEGTRRLTPSCLAYHAALDFEKFDWELRFFMQNYVERLMGAPLSTAEDALLRDWLRGLARETGGHARVFCHRDYHSRNLIVHQGRLFMFDFQDSRWGPRTYDLASLLRDSYVELSDETVGSLFDYYRQATGVPAGGLRAEFDRVSLQRNIKAMGTFAYQAAVKNNPIYLQYVPRTLGYVIENLKKLPSDSAVLSLFTGKLRFTPAPG